MRTLRDCPGGKPILAAAQQQRPFPASQVDILATLAAIVGYDLLPGSAEDSHNQWPVWKEDAPSPRDTIVHNTFNNAYAVRHKDWVLIAAPTGNHSKVPKWFNKERGYTKDGLPGELYNLNDDLAQKNNLYQKNPELVKELLGFLSQVREKGQIR